MSVVLVQATGRIEFFVGVYERSLLLKVCPTNYSPIADNVPSAFSGHKFNPYVGL